MPFHASSWHTLLRAIENIETLNKGVDRTIAPTFILTNSSLLEIHNIVESMQNAAALNVKALNILNIEALNTYLQHLTHVLDREPDTHEVVEHPEKGLLLPETRERIVLYSPSLHLLEKLRSSQMSLHDLHWRQLEELVAEMLTQDGYHVQIGRGTKDGGVDIIAVKEDPITGLFMAVWQAKKLKIGNKVDIHVIRELADYNIPQNLDMGIR